MSSGETGCIKEESLTLRGKIEDPEFTFKFASVGNDHAPTNMEDNEPSETEASGATVDSRQSSARPPDLGIASGSVQENPAGSPTVDAPAPAAQTTAVHETPHVLTPLPMPVSTADDQTAAVRAINLDAAEQINSYCGKSTVTSPNRNVSSKTCAQREIDAWQRIVLGREFPAYDPALDRKCSEPPFPPDSFVAKEACLKYELRTR